MWPDREMHPRYTDSYFNLTRKIVQENGDAHVTYAVFMRRPVTLASKLAIDWLLKITEERGVSVKIEKLFKGAMFKFVTKLIKSWGTITNICQNIFNG